MLRVSSCDVCCTVVAELRRRAAADRATAVGAGQAVSADACTSSQRAQPRAHHRPNGEAAAAPGCSRRRARKKRDGGGAAARGTAVDVAGDSTDSSEDAAAAAAAADKSRPSRKLRRKKKKTKKVGAEGPRIENPVAPVELMAVKVNGVVGDVDEDLSVEEDSRQNGATVSTSSFVDACTASLEVDGLSCEPEGSSSQPEAEVIERSVCSTVGSGRSGLSPVARPSPLPATSTTAGSTTLYGQQSAFVADVHGSMPLLSRSFDDDRRPEAATDPRPSLIRRPVPKSSSLQGYQNLLSVDDALTAAGRRHRHRRRLTSANYRPLADQRGRLTLSRLDVEYINRSQIFHMISGQSAFVRSTRMPQRCL